jgi:N-acetyl-anhydromuramyl-L-alanine amidase AmpD
VVHVSGGSAESTKNTFQDPDRQASYHYIVDLDGEVYQFVREAAVAWHAGYWPMNQRSIGVASAGSLKTNDDKTVEMYSALARLTAHLSTEYRIPVDRKHIIGHYQVPGYSGSGGGFSCHSDPGEGWNWRKFMRLIREYAS